MWTALAVVMAAGIFAAPAQAARQADLPLGGAAPQVGYEVSLVTRVQKALSALGYFHGIVNGNMSPELQAAIRRYQRETGRDVDGRVSEKLAERLETQRQIGTMLSRLDRTREAKRRAARKALLEDSATRGLIAPSAVEEVADPTRDASPCFRSPEEACLLTEAVESAKGIAKAELRDWAFGEILVAQAKSGLVEDAISTVRRIGDERLIIVALRDIARAQARSGKLSGAQEAAAIIPDRFKRLEALAAIADIQLRRRDGDGAAKTASSVAAEARKLETPLQRVTLLAQMAIVLYKVGATRDAALLLNEAQSIAESRSLAQRLRKVERGAALRHVAAAFSEIGQPRRALAVIDDVASHYDRTAILMSAASAQALAGNPADALATAERIGSPRYRAVTYGRIAINQAKQGAQQAAAETIAKALSATKAIKMPYARSYAVGQLALALVEIGGITGRDGFAQAVETAGKIENERLKAYALWTASAAQARSGYAADAKKTAVLAREATDRITGALSQVWMFGDLATETAERGEHGPAAALLRRGLAIAENIHNAWARARALAKMAAAMHDIQ